VIDKEGVEGQGNKNPPAFFQQHFIVSLDLGDPNAPKFYDPSYGKAFKSLMEWENESLAGFTKNIPGRGWCAKKNELNKQEVRTYTRGQYPFER
jgi:hypothetical protein